MYIKVRFSKVHGGEAVRTGDVIGFASALPEVGKSFIINSDPVDKKYSYREITTSIIQYIERDGEAYIIHTLNSVYRVEVL
jgi:hypothetical protein